jgi:hypothetical protein
MGPERARVTSHPQERELVDGQTAAVWFADNRVDDGRRICIVRRGTAVSDIGFVYDLAPHEPGRVQTTFTPMVPPFMSLDAAARFVLRYLFGDAP